MNATLKKLKWVASAALILVVGATAALAAQSGRPVCFVKEGLASGGCGDRQGGSDCTIRFASCDESCPANFKESCTITEEYDVYTGGRSKALAAAKLNCPANAVIVYQDPLHRCRAEQPESVPVQAPARRATSARLQ